MVAHIIRRELFAVSPFIASTMPKKTGANDTQNSVVFTPGLLVSFPSSIIFSVIKIDKSFTLAYFYFIFYV